MLRTFPAVHYVSSLSGYPVIYYLIVCWITVIDVLNLIKNQISMRNCCTEKIILGKVFITRCRLKLNVPDNWSNIVMFSK